MDIVYFVKIDSENDSQELRYSLRSLKNIPHGNVIIAGEKPDWVQNVIHLPVAQTKTKAENVTMNLHAAVDSPLVANEFLLMNDDFFIMHPVATMPLLHFGPMAEVIAQFDRRYPEGSPYIANMKLLYRQLRDRGITHPISYELHTPMLLHKDRILQLRTLDIPLYQFRTFYGNYFDVGGKAVEDVKVFLDPQHNAPAFNSDPQSYLRQQPFLSVTGGSFKRGLPGEYVRAMFTETSPYER